MKNNENINKSKKINNSINVNKKEMTKKRRNYYNIK